jgi:uncharacterized membrane protein YphA (DoxX/SURF4 family)
MSTQIFGGLFPIPKVDIPDPATLWPMRQMIFWAADHIFHARLPLVYAGSGSGDKTFDWVLAFCLLIFAALATGIWSVLDCKRENYVTSYKWFRLFIRFALASQLLTYGMDKAIPLQMPFPLLTTLIEPFHDFSPMGVLWSSIGASPAYEIFVGCAELLGGILLIFPRTTMLGALVCLADMTQVFLLNIDIRCPGEAFLVPPAADGLVPAGPGVPASGGLLFPRSRRRALDATSACPHRPRQPGRARRANRLWHLAARDEYLWQLDPLVHLRRWAA